MKFLFKIIFCVPLFIILSNFIRYKDTVSSELFKFKQNYIKISSESEAICLENVFRLCSCDDCIESYLFWTFFTLFALSVLLIIFNFWRFFGILVLILSLIFYYLFLDADFFVFGMIGGLLLLIDDAKSVKIEKNYLKNPKKAEKTKKKLKNNSKSVKKTEVVHDKGEDLLGATESEDLVALQWKEYDLKYRPMRSKFKNFMDEWFSKLKFPKKKITRSIFPEFLALTVLICSCVAFLIVANLLKLV